VILWDIGKHSPDAAPHPSSGVPRNFVQRGVQQIQLRTEERERTGIWGQ